MDRPLLKTAEWKSIGKPMRPWRSVYSWPVTQSKFRSQTVRHHYHIVRHTWTLLLHRVMEKKNIYKNTLFSASNLFHIKMLCCTIYFILCSIFICCLFSWLLPRSPGGRRGHQTPCSCTQTVSPGFRALCQHTHFLH